MDNISEFISSYPTGRWKIENSVATPNRIQKNVKTAAQASAERNEKINKNEFICDNIETDDKENFTNFNSIENFNNNRCSVTTNHGSVFIYIFFLVIIILFLYTTYIAM